MKKILKRHLFRALTVLLAVVMLSGVTAEARAGVSTDYTLTGNQAEDVLTVAKAQIGKTRSDFGWTVDWCGYFTGWSGYTAGADFPTTKTYWANGRMITYWFVKNNKGTFYYFRDGNYDSLVSHHADLNSAALSRCIKSNRSTFVPKRGDIIHFLWNNADASTNWSHVGLVDSYSNGTITTIEGNVNDKVVKTTHKLSDTQVVGFVRPNYVDNSNKKPVLTIQFNASKQDGTPSVSSDTFSMDSSGYIVKNGTRDLTTWELGYGYPSGLYNVSSFGLTNDSWAFVGWERTFGINDTRVFDEDRFYLAEQIYPELKDGSQTVTLYARWEYLNPGMTGKSGLYTVESTYAENMLLTVAEGSNSSGANLQLNQATGSSSQIFRLEELAGQTGVYSITSLASGLKVNACGTVSGDNVDQESANSSLAQQWTLVYGGGERVWLSPMNDSGLLMQIDDANYAEGSNVMLGLRVYDDHASWKLNALSGWQKIDNVWYYFENGNAVTGWKQVDGASYYFNNSGVMQTGWQQIGGNWYYLGSAMATGWKQVGSTWYYFNASGVMQTGWQKINNVWYYLGSNGAMQTGWQSISGSWYYLGSNGAMQTGWQKINGTWYYLGTNGKMVTGWQKIGSTWYYFSSNGAMVTGWQAINGKTYFFKTTGAMASGEWCDGYWLNADGTFTYPYRASWHQNDKGWWYGDASGWYAKNTTVVIDGKSYTFDANGYMK